MFNCLNGGIAPKELLIARAHVLGRICRDQRSNTKDQGSKIIPFQTLSGSRLEDVSAVFLAVGEVKATPAEFVEGQQKVGGDFNKFNNTDTTGTA